MDRLILIILLYPVILFGQSNQSARYLKLYERYREEKKPDSVVVVCQQLIQTDKRLAKERHLNYYMAIAAFEANQTELAVKQSKKMLPYFYICGRTREASSQNIRYQHLSNRLANYYHEKENYRKEYYHLSRIKRRFNHLFCGNGRPAWQNSLYQRMIDASNKQGRTKRAKRLERELEEWTKNRISTNF